MRPSVQVGAKACECLRIEASGNTPRLNQFMEIKMTSGYMGKFISRAVFVSALLALWGCDKSMELQQISQCISPVTGGELSSGSRGDLELIPEKQCYGLYWAIPLAYEPFLFGTPVENLNITMGLLDQTPGAHMTDVRKARELPEISVYPQVSDEFQARIAEVRKAAEDTYGLQSTARSMYGMDVLMSDTSASGGMVMFYPRTLDGAMVVCNIAAGQDESQIDPLTLCSVTTYMNEWLFAEYHILYSLMPQFELINSVLVNNILEFRTRQPGA